VQIVNSSTTGVGNTNNNTAVIIDEDDVNAEQHNWLGPMFGINMITGWVLEQITLFRAN
jgi:hypothetical protein